MQTDEIPNAPPDWQTIQRNVTCPLCDYNLRGLTDPVCPECGHHFAWPDVLDPQLRTHLYLFEHHPEQNVKSFFRTLRGTLDARTFWTTVRPEQPARIGRLVSYWAIGAEFCLLPAVIVIVWRAHRLLAFLPLWANRPGPSILTRLWRDGFIRGLTIGCLLMAIYPWLTYLSLRVFAQSMKRAKVKPVHVMRCAIYCGDVIFWNGLIATPPIIGWINFHWTTDTLAWSLVLTWCILVISCGIRLSAAYRHYMKFDHAKATVIASQLMVALAMFTAMAWAVWLL